MATTLHQFDQTLKALIHGVSAVTQAATAPMIRLTAALRPLPAVRAANDTLTRLITAAGGANAADVNGTAHSKPLGAVTIKREGTDGGRSRHDPERPVRTLAQTLHRIAALAPQRVRPTLDASRADTRARSLDTSLRRFANLVAAPAERFSRAESIASTNPLRQAPAANGMIENLGANPVQSRPARDASASRWSVSAYALGGLRTTITRLSPLLAPARARARSVVGGERLSRSTVTSTITRLLAQPRFAFTDYSRTAPLYALTGAARAVLEQPLMAYLRRLGSLPQKITSVAIQSAGVASPNIAAVAHASHLQPATPRGRHPFTAHTHEVSPRRRPLFDRLDRPTPPSAVPATAPVPPSTINVAINVHGVANGDDFVRRHGYAIAQVLDQVMERRARRAF